MEFASWKIEASKKIEELTALEQKRYHMAQQILMMDLHQKATYGQFKELLAKIGSFTPTVDSYRPTSKRLPILPKSRASEIEEKLQSLFNRCRDAKSQLDENMEKIMFETSRNDVLKNFATHIPVQKDPEDEINEPINLFEMIAEETVKSMKIDDDLQIVWRQVIFLSTLEEQLQNELEELLNLGQQLIEERKWHCDGNTATRMGPLVFFHDSFSIC